MYWTTYGVLRTTEEQDNILTSHAGPSDRTPREVKCRTLSAGATRIPVGTLLNYSKQGLFWHRKISANLSDIVIRGAKRISTDGRFKARNNSFFRNDPAQRLPPNADLTLAVIHTELSLFRSARPICLPTRPVWRPARPPIVDCVLLSEIGRSTCLLQENVALEIDSNRVIN